MRAQVSLAFVIVGLSLSSPSAVAKEDPKTVEAGVLFTGTRLPAPPAQELAWKAPTSSFSELWLSALGELMRYGFADPRGCEYREVRLTWGSSIWGGCRLVTTRAWVIPQARDNPKESQRFAVTWDGLVYPVVKLGPAADLKKDVLELIKQSEKASAAGPRFPSQWGYVDEFAYSYGRPYEMRRWSERELISHDSLVALKCCILLRLGEVTLAEQLWAAWLNRDSQILGEGPNKDPYMIFAWEWAWALFDRAVAAHLRGDDVVALHTATILVPFEKSVPDVATKRGFTQFRNFGSNQIVPFLPLRDSPTRLLEELQRRVQEGPVQRVLEAGADKFPDKATRIAALIRDLEAISAGPEYEMGGWPLSPPYISWNGGSVLVMHEGPPVNPLKVSPVVQALVKESDAAVEPLLDCLANDRRLTRVAGRSPSTCGDFLAERDFIGVDLAAYWALCGILRAERFGPLTERGYYHSCQESEPGSETRAAVAAEIRRRWERARGHSPEEAWLAALADPDMTCKTWLEAARRIVARLHRDKDGKLVESTHTMQYNSEIRVLETDEDLALPMAGEVLRAMKNPSVTELLIQRSDASASAAGHYFDWESVCDLTLCLARWDPKAAVPAIHRRLTDLRSPENKFRFGEQGLDFLARSMADLCEAGLQPGEDESILRDYATWLRTTPPSDFSFFDASIFMPLWRHPDNPQMAELAGRLFLDKDAPWLPTNRLKKPLSAYEIIETPLIGVPAFREMIKREFTDTTVLGHFTIERDRISIGAWNTSMGADLRYAPDAELKIPDAGQPLQACDYYALRISELEGSPRYELYWPEARRAAARKEMAEFLDHWGDAFRDHSKCLGLRLRHSFASSFQLLPLVRPATPEDVAAGRAIFSLRGQADPQVRTVPLKPYPRIARWKTYEKLRFRDPQVLEWPKNTDRIDRKAWEKLPLESFDREGYVWQAEEILVDGKWRRYYGFIGNHVIAKVPAEEIEILEQFSPAHPHRW